MAIKKAGIDLNQINAVAYTKGPGLMGSLLVGGSFAKGMSMALNVPLIEINHMKAHILAHFIKDEEHQKIPSFPFLCLTVSGGHTQIVLVRDFNIMEIIGETLDDAAGEAFDKVAKILKLPYPGGPLVDKNAQSGNPKAFKFPKPQIEGFNYSFSGFKTAILNFIHKETNINPDFVSINMNDICASVQHSIVEILLNKFGAAIKQYKVRDICLAGGVSANSELRKRFAETGEKHKCSVFIPPFQYCTDNAAMIGIAGYYKFLSNDFADASSAPSARLIF